jgi:hypothetical protein
MQAAKYRVNLVQRLTMPTAPFIGASAFITLAAKLFEIMNLLQKYGAKSAP